MQTCTDVFLPTVCDAAVIEWLFCYSLVEVN